MPQPPSDFVSAYVVVAARSAQEAQTAAGKLKVPGAWFGGPVIEEGIGTGSGGATTHDVVEHQLVPAPLRYVADGLSNTALVVEQSGRPTWYSADPAVGRSNREPWDWDQGRLHAPLTPWARPDPALLYGASNYAAAWRGPINQTNVQGLYSFHSGVNALLGDASVRFLEGSSVDLVAGLLTREAGDVLPAD